MDPDSTMYNQLDLSQIMTVDLDLAAQCLQLCSLSTYENTLIETTVSLLRTSPDFTLVTQLAQENLISAQTPIFNESGQKIGCVHDYLSQVAVPFSIASRKKFRRRFFHSAHSHEFI